jgi:hypothetical protein
VSTADAGNYSVIVTNSTGTATSSVVSLTVINPLITTAVKGADGNLSLGFVGLPDTATRVWATTNLASPGSWLPIFTNTTTYANGTWQFTDTNTAVPTRFYRFSTP